MGFRRPSCPALLAVLLLACLACHQGGGGRKGAPTFAKSYGASATDLAADVEETPDGGYVMVGSFNGRRLDGVLVDEDLWVTKLDAFGDLEWSYVISENQTSVGNAEQERLMQIALARVGGGFFLVGDVGRLYAVDGYSEFPTDLAVTRLDDDGNTLWEMTYGLPELPRYENFDPERPPSENPNAAVPTANGGLLIGGTAVAQLRQDGRPSFGMAPWVMRIDAAGAVEWQGFEEADLYNVAFYYNAGIHLCESSDGGAVAAVPEEVFDHVDPIFDKKKFKEKTRVTRFDDRGGVVWTMLLNGFVAQDIAATGSGPAERFFLVGDDFDELSADDRPMRVLDANGEETHRRDDIEAFAHILAGAHAAPYFASVGLSEAAGDHEHVRLEIFDDQLEPWTSVDLPEATALLDLRSLSDADGVTFELFVSNLQDVDAQTGELLDVIIDSDGNIDRFTRYDRDVPSFVNWGRTYGTRVAGWFPDSTDYWLWMPLDGDDRASGFTLSRYHLTAGQRWSRTFSSSLDRRVERALDVEVIPDDADPASFEIAVLGQVAWDPLQDPPPAGERLSAWYLRLDQYGQLVTQRVLEELVIDTERQAFDPTTGEETAPSLRRSAQLLATAPDGDLFLGGHVEGYARVVRLDAAGDVVWSTRPLADAGRGALRALAPTSDGGVVGLGEDWLVKVGDDGEVDWRRAFPFPGLGGAAEVADGALVVAASLVGQPVVFALDASGDRLWEFVLDPEEAVFHDVAADVASTAAGGALLAFGKLGQLALPVRDGFEDAAWDLRLLEVDALGDVLWSQTYGALLEETLGGVCVASDGGLVLAGRSDSLGEGSEAWVLRTDSAGRIVTGCRAALARFEPAPPAEPQLAFHPSEYVPAIPVGDDVPGVVISYPTSARVVAVRDQVVVARQCSGRSSDVAPGGPDPDPDPDPGGGPWTLTIVHEGGAGGTVTSSPGGIDCGATCSAQYADATVVGLFPRPDAGAFFSHWEGCDEDFGIEGCSVTMTSDRTVRVWFE